MSLILIRRAGRPTWYVRGTVAGQSVYESTGTARRADAEAYKAQRESQLWRREVFGARAVVTFAEAVSSYLTAEPRSPNQAALVARLLHHFATTPLAQIKQEQLDRAYAVLLRPGAAPATKLRNVLTPLRAILEHAARRDWCDRPAFEVPKPPPARIAYLTPAQATALVHAAAPHLRPLLVFLIATGARMSEALELDWRHVDLAAARVHLVRTKTGADRRVDLPPAAVAALSQLQHREGRVFRPGRARRADGRPSRALPQIQYADNDRTSGGQIASGWASACGRAGLPGTWHEQPRTDREKGTVRIFRPELHPHDLRHTAATWHYAIHRDILRLKAWGGWSSVKQVEGYAHLLPQSYVDAAAEWLGLPTATSAASVPPPRGNAATA
jgi:integrase